ncbi:MAG TPA: shikimate kinase [bacterium]|nr:shikimate kinase [bacterium]HOL46729.1 shikimate kinase [bacterium]HPQ18165.1 shikimate kinase [bacterium]
MKKNIILIGYRGAGKTTIGKILANKINYNFIDSDEQIEKSEGRKISEIVKKEGWQYFREVEKKIIKQLGSEKNAVISTGGGIVLNIENVNNLKENGWFVYLETTPETIVKRIQNDDNRPSLTGVKSFIEEVTEVLEQRKELYEKYADFKILTDNMTPEKISEVIENEFRKI